MLGEDEWKARVLALHAFPGLFALVLRRYRAPALGLRLPSI
ncbi:hypothetical protein FHX63_005613 [Cupriavidus plantarum]|nr:hypothetical protein [Cupriavidus plantarum]